MCPNVPVDLFCYRCGEPGHVARDCERTEDGKRHINLMINAKHAVIGNNKSMNLQSLYAIPFSVFKKNYLTHFYKYCCCFDFLLILFSAS